MVKRRNAWIFAVLTILVLALMLIAGYAMKQMDAEKFSMGGLSEPVLGNLIASAGPDKDIAGPEKGKASKVKAPGKKTGSTLGGVGSVERGGKTGTIAVIRDALPGGSVISPGGKMERPVTPPKPPVGPNDPVIPSDPVVPNEPVDPVDPQPEDDFVTGEIPEKPGYDVATVRYVFEDGSYKFADFSKVDGKYRYKFPKQQKKVKVIPEYFSTEKWDGAVDISWYDPEKTQYNISSGAQLAGLAAIVNGSVDRELPDYRIKGDPALIKNKKMEDFPLTGAGGGDQKTTVYKATGDTDFMGKTVHITADLDMGGTQDAVTGKWSAPNYTPIGGKYPMEISTGDHLIEAFFNGVLDGHGHRIINLNCNRYTDKGFAYSQAIGLVGYLGDVDKGKEMLED